MSIFVKSGLTSALQPFSDGGLDGRDAELLEVLTAKRRYFHRLSYRPLSQDPVNIVDARDALSIQVQDDISNPEATLFRRPGVVHGNDLDGMVSGQLIEAYEPAVEGTAEAHDSQVAPPDPSLADKL